MPVAKKQRQVEAHRHCPSCFNGMGGIGNAYTKVGRKTYYKCGSCGHTWTAIISHETVTVTRRTVELDTRGKDDISTSGNPDKDNQPT